MAQEIEEIEVAELEEKQSRAGMLLTGLFVIVYVLLIGAYAWQTYELVNWLFPDDNWPMKVMGVFVCDGCALLYAAGETFYKFKLRKTFHLVGIMWGLTFIMSTVASAVNLYLSSVHRIPHAIDPNVLSTAYIINIVAFIANIVAFTFVFRLEWTAGKPKRVYLDDGKPKRVAVQPVQSQQQQVMSSVPITQPPVQSEHIDIARWEAMLREMAEGMKTRMTLEEREAVRQQVIQEYSQQQPSQNPLAQPPLDTQASQQGTQNGNSNGHQK